MLEDILDRYHPILEKSVGTPYGCIEHSPEPYVNFSDQFSYLFNSNYSSNSSVNLSYSPGPVVKEESLYTISVENTLRDWNGQVIAVLGRLLGYMNPTDESGTLRVYTAGDSLPADVRFSVQEHELRHDEIHNEEANRKQDKVNYTHAYEWYWQ